MQPRKPTNKIIEICKIARELYFDLDRKETQNNIQATYNKKWSKWSWSHLLQKNPTEKKVEVPVKMDLDVGMHYPSKNEIKEIKVEKKRDFEHYNANRIEGSNFFAVKGPQTEAEFETLLDNMLSNKNPAIKINHIICLGAEGYDFLNYMMPPNPEDIERAQGNYHSNVYGNGYFGSNPYNTDWNISLPNYQPEKLPAFENFNNFFQDMSISAPKKEGEPDFDSEAFMRADDIQLKKYNVSIEVVEENEIYSESKLTIRFKDNENRDRVEYVTVTKFDVNNGDFVKIHQLKDVTPESNQLLEKVKEKLIALADMVSKEMTVVHCMNGRGRTGNFICQIELLNHIKEILNTNDNHKIAENAINVLKRIRQTRPSLISNHRQFYMALYNALELHLFQLKKECKNKKKITESVNSDMNMRFFQKAPSAVSRLSYQVSTNNLRQ